VYVIFGPAWAEAWCAFSPRPADQPAPSPYGFVEDPVAVLDLSSTLNEAREILTTDPAAAARLLRVVADALGHNGFPGHARVVRGQEAGALAAAGQLEDAFGRHFSLAIERFDAGETFAPPLVHDAVELRDRVGDVSTAKATVLEAIAQWYEVGVDLDSSVPALETIVAAADEHRAYLCCIVLEQAVVDGLFEFRPPSSLVSDPWHQRSRTTGESPAARAASGR
jgi:hypothetical protein